ncbi:armadillo-type protein [Apodospora peruviana]|uniref:Armadillo-type protein n=1 Tax=Apodospora peruviana TaxID=516989 RepID=A0AAE0IBU1_9PEZI|nr:armadillo-type protein [Apodospora peruviana]
MTTVPPPPAAASSEPRTDFFRQLKPLCVPLSQLILRSKDKVADAKEILRLIEALTALWTAQASRDAGILDGKLADYVFFPLSHLLRTQDQYPIRVIEATIRLIRSLIQYGWKANLGGELSQQLLVFFSFTVGGLPGQSSTRRELPEETVVEGYRAIAVLVSTTGPGSLVQALSDDNDKSIPALGHSLTVVLDGIAAGVPPLIQLEALQCLRVFFTVVFPATVYARFLPGTVSTLSRLLSPPAQQKTQRRVLVGCLEVLELVLVTVLGDVKIRSILNKLQESTSSEGTQPGRTEEDAEVGGELTPAWLKAASAQVKIALSSVLKLRSHESEQLQATMDHLCITLLDQCHSSLADSHPILVETAMMLEDEETRKSLLQTSLQDLAGIYPELGNSIKSTLYGWITGLPRLMQSNDELVKQLAIRSILRGTKLAAALHMDSSTLDDSLGDALRDSIVGLIRNSKPSKLLDDVETDGELWAGTSGGVVVDSRTETVPYRPVLLDLEGQKTTRTEISTLISNIGSSVQQVKLGAKMLSSLRDSEGVDQIASFWLAFELLKATYAQTADLDELFDLSSFDEAKSQERVFQELYDFSASVIASHSDASEENDWRLEAIALEVTAFAASRLKVEFRPELIDVLYPITTCLGSQVPQLRRHAVTTLNRLAQSCGYGSVSELIIDNVDYMVNSISLRLNTFDISPASTKVLAMMVKLTGPRLIPYLDDVVAAIFAALDNYHGYPVFVESLFSVLSEMVNQGVRSDMLLLQDTAVKSVDHKKRKQTSLGIAGILDILEQRANRQKSQDEDDDIKGGCHPKEAWKSSSGEEAKSLLDRLEAPGSDDDDHDEDEDGKNSAAVDNTRTESDQPKTPTYSLLARVLTLTQHYLTSPTPTLRKSLLVLVATVSPALAADDNAFLPLVHTLWPVVVSRLHDGEPFVAVAACKALAALCGAAGDFLATRFKTEWYTSSGIGGTQQQGLGKWFAKVKADAAVRGTNSRLKAPAVLSRGGSGGEILVPPRYPATVEAVSDGGVGGGQQSPLTQTLMSLALNNTMPSTTTVGTTSKPVASSSLSLSSGGNAAAASASALGRFSQASQLWDAAVELLTAMVRYVRIDDDMFDEVLELLVDVCVLPGQRGDDVREALEAINADAVWLALYKRGRVEMKAEQSEPVDGLGFGFVRLEVLAGS